MKKCGYVSLSLFVCAVGCWQHADAQEPGAAPKSGGQKTRTTKPPIAVRQDQLIDYLFTLPDRKGHLSFGKDIMAQIIALSIEALPIDTDERKLKKEHFIKEFATTFADEKTGQTATYEEHLLKLPRITQMRSGHAAEKSTLEGRISEIEGMRKALETEKSTLQDMVTTLGAEKGNLTQSLGKTTGELNEALDKEQKLKDAFSSFAETTDKLYEAAFVTKSCEDVAVLFPLYEERKNNLFEAADRLNMDRNDIARLINEDTEPMAKRRLAECSAHKNSGE